MKRGYFFRSLVLACFIIILIALGFIFVIHFNNAFHVVESRASNLEKGDEYGWYDSSGNLHSLISTFSLGFLVLVFLGLLALLVSFVFLRYSFKGKKKTGKPGKNKKGLFYRR